MPTAPYGVDPLTHAHCSQLARARASWLRSASGAIRNVWLANACSLILPRLSLAGCFICVLSNYMTILLTTEVLDVQLLASQACIPHTGFGDIADMIWLPT